MAVNKNFVVKNGIEVATNLIVADPINNRVGLGTTAPEALLDVRGPVEIKDGPSQIAAVDIAGITTVREEFNVGVGGTSLTVDPTLGRVGINSATPQYTLDVRSSVSTGQTALYVFGDMRVTGDLNLDDITLDDASIQNLTVTDTLAVTGLSTFSSNVDINAGLDVAGISSVGAAITMYPSSGIVSATSFYGDGSNLTGIATGLSAAIGVSSEGTFVGSGATIVDFKTTTGTNINNVTVSSGVATVTIQPGVSLGLAIALGG